MKTDVADGRVASTSAERIAVDEDIQQEDGAGFDKLAIGLSVLCLVHCLALPLVMLAMPALESVVLGTESPVHWVLLGMALPVSAYALWHGYGHHGHRSILVFGSSGLTLMLIGVSHLTSRTLETPLTVVGVALLLAAHVLNLRHNARCSHAG